MIFVAIDGGLSGVYVQGSHLFVVGGGTGGGKPVLVKMPMRRVLAAGAFVVGATSQAFVLPPPQQCLHQPHRALEGAYTPSHSTSLSSGHQATRCWPSRLPINPSTRLRHLVPTSHHNQIGALDEQQHQPKKVSSRLRLLEWLRLLQTSPLI